MGTFPAHDPTSVVNGIDRLLELQELDLSIDRLEARQRELEGEEDVRSARAAMEQAEGKLGELRLAVDSLDREQHRLEQEIDSIARKAEAEQRRLYDGTVANPKELEALQHEIGSLNSRRGRVEDELLEQMVRREDLDGKLATAEAELAEARERLAEIGGQASRELEEIHAALLSRRAERTALVPAFDEELLDLYEELRRQKRGIGAAALIDGVCQGCHQKLSALELDRLKRVEGAKRCDYCRRILIPA
jgi:uncharacterized protein